MAEKTFNNIRFQLKYDTYTNWTTNNPVLKQGEMAIATIENNTDGVQNAPSVLIKVGDGQTDYKNLKFVSGLAADVYSWAKAANKPTYEATEIGGIGDYIAQYVDETLGISVDTNTVYRMLKVDDYNYKLQSKAAGEEDTAFVDVSEINIPKYDDTEVKGLIDANEEAIAALEALVGSTAVSDQIDAKIEALDLANTYEAKGEAAKVQESLDAYKESNDTAVQAAQKAAEDAQADIDAMAELVGTSSVDTQIDEKIAELDLANTYDAKGAATAVQNDLDAYKESNNTAVQEAKDAADAAQEAADGAQAEVDALEALVGTVAEGKTVVQMIEDAQTAATYDDTALVARVEKNEQDIATLNGDAETAGSVAYQIAQAVAAIMENPDETMNSINELVTWVNDHAQDALELSNNVSANAQAIEALEGLVGDKAVATQITEAITSALTVDGVDKYALATDLTAAVARISTLETEVAKKANDADLAAIAKTGNVNDLVQTEGDVLIFNCGDSSNC